MEIERYEKKYLRKLVTLVLVRYTSHRKHFKNKKLLFHFHLSYSFNLFFLQIQLGNLF